MKGDLYIISAPSGAGKTSLVAELIKQDPQLTLSVSHTTRPQRPGEQQGINYHFVSSEEFKKLVEQQAFLEHAHVFDYDYGTSKQWVMAQLEQGKDVVLEIDWQGAEQIKRLYPQAIGIFIFPPSQQALEERLQKRGQDSAAIITKRLQSAEEDIKHAKYFDYWIVNDNFSKAVQDLQAIIRAQHLRPEKQPLAALGIKINFAH